MTIYVDDMQMHAVVGRVESNWSHLFSDKSKQELINFAREIGLSPIWIQDSRGFIHFDVTENMRLKAISHGAKPCSYRDITNFFDRENGVYKYKGQA